MKMTDRVSFSSCVWRWAILCIHKSIKRLSAMANVVEETAECRGGVTTLDRVAGEALSTKVTFKQEERLTGSWLGEEQGRRRGRESFLCIKGRMCKSPKKELDRII